MTLTTGVIWANVILFTVAFGTSIWAAQGSANPVLFARRIKSVLTLVYIAGNVSELYGSDVWADARRWVSLASLGAVWIFPDVASMIWRDRTLKRIDEITKRVLDDGTPDP